jgi:hypothetical protein
MSWSGTFTHGVAIGLDYGLEMVAFWRAKEPMTVSSQAGLALRRKERTTGLARLGRFLNWLSPGHCEQAIAADIARAKQAIADLSA